MNILLTGGAGYIGSHAAVVLSGEGHEVVILDNFCNSRKRVLGQLQKILGRSLPCVEGDIRNTFLVDETLKKYKIDAVIHFAGLKAVGESFEKPIEYYSNNVHGAISLIQAMEANNVKILVFSSSATIYGEPQYLPIDEQHPIQATNPYGQTKLLVEELLKDVANSNPDWKIICLRYFNPVGSHESGFIGEDPQGLPNNLLPYVARVATGTLPTLNIYGSDYQTSDGTGVRDYIHVMDLAEGHLAAINYLKNGGQSNFYNLGTGAGYSVLEMVKAYEKAANTKISTSFCDRRPGDVPSSYANVDKARIQLGWVARRSIEDICESSWLFQNRDICD